MVQKVNLVYEVKIEVFKFYINFIKEYIFVWLALCTITSVLFHLPFDFVFSVIKNPFSNVHYN